MSRSTHLIFDWDVTTASVHDIKIELCKKEELDYKDRGYFKNNQKSMNGIMNKSTRNHPLNIHEKRRNQRISSKRAPVERTYSVVKRLSNQHTKLTTINRNKTKTLMLMIIYDIEQLITLENQKNKEKNKENEKIVEYSFSSFFLNSTIYYENKTYINFATSTLNKDHLKKSHSKRKKPKINKNPLKISKTEYKRQQKRKINKKIKERKKKINKKYKETLTKINEFNLQPITI